MKKLCLVVMAGWLVMAGWGCAKHNPLGPQADAAAAKPVKGAWLSTIYMYLKSWGSYGSTDNQFLDPMDMTFNANGNLWIADYFLNCVKLFTPDGTYVRKIDTVYRPLSVAVNTANNYIYVPVMVPNSPSTIYKIRVYNPAGTLLAVWPQAGATYTLKEPRGIAVYNNRVYVCDGGNYRVLVLNLTDGSLLQTWNNPDPASGTTFKPQSIALDPMRSRVYVADGYNRVFQLTFSGYLLSRLNSTNGSGNWSWPQSVTLDNSGNVYVADTYNARIQKFDSTGKFLKVWGTQGTGNGQFKIPITVRVDASGNVYVLDEMRRDVQIFTPIIIGW